MANKRITDVDFIKTLDSNESFFINQNNAIKQINKTNIIFGIANGGTGATTPEEARANLGITASSGALLYVNAPVGVTVIAAKGETTYDKVADSSGLAIFENLSVGTWTIKITDGDDIAIQTVTVEPDYSVTMEFFAAYISVTYPEGSTCTCTDGNTILTAPDTNGSCIFTVKNTGTWTIKSTNGSQSDTETVSITANKQSKSVALKYFTAYISVTYPSGSTCTCTDGTTTMTASDTSGSYTFTVKNTGTWTVKSVDGDKIDSKAVSIITDGQSESVALNYFAATIAVTYPEGSTCTCTDGSTTLTAADTSGNYVFTVSNTGTWTVYCTDGTDSDSKSISITTDGQSVNVELFYGNYLYNAGDECSTITGGWSKYNGTLTKNSDNLTLTNVGASTSNYAAAYTNSMMDLTGYQTLHVIAKGHIQSGAGASTFMVVTKTKTNQKSGVTSTTDIGDNLQEYVLNVSSLSGTYYVGFMVSGSNNTYSLEVQKVWRK